MLACGPNGGSAPASITAASPASAGAPAGLVDVTLESVGLDSAALDRSADPCSDFYQFACGKWLEKTEIPADEPSWMRSFNEIEKRNEHELRSILEGASTPETDPGTLKVRSFYGACMAESAIDAAGVHPLDALLAQVRQVTDAKRLAAVTTELHALEIWPFFDVSPVQDPKDATHWVANLDQGGLGLPDRDYYLKDDAGSKELRAFYRGHVERMLGLAGAPAADARAGAADVLRLETELAKISKTRVERRDPKGMFNRWERAQLAHAAPAFRWDGYFDRLGLPIQALNVTAPKFFAGLSPLIAAASPAALRAYLEWHILHSTARQLSKPLLEESFKLEQKLTGQAELKPRWRRCVAASDAALGDLLGEAYVKKDFAGPSKQAAEQLVHAISAAFQADLGGLTWMDETTRARASEKQRAMEYLIGYPDKWKTYDFDVDRTSHLANVLRARAFELKRDLAKVGKLVDRREWDISPPTVNAYYDPQRNHMVFPAGILQPPFYDVKSAAAVNLGAIGMVVGHELTHGFDDEGSQYDAKGNLSNWWAADVSQRFQERTACLAEQYDQYEALPGVHLNGRLTLGENIADLGGMKLAFAAYHELRKGQAQQTSAGGFNDDQQFFLAVGQAWCTKSRPEFERMMVQVDPHSPPRFRVRGPLSDLTEFAQAFSCPADAAMRAKKACEVW
jgi:putative endopeptidase